jgi:dipeptidyl aminopeptidase/acylaminoacyl peptidase
MNQKFVVIFVLAVIGLGYFLYGQPDPKPADDQGPATTVAPYGAWESPLSAASIFESADSISTLTTANNQLYFIERRASENGRNVLVRLTENATTVLSPAGISVRSRVHEYGGLPYVMNGEDIYYSNFEDQMLYRLSPGTDPVALTPEGLRYMQCIVDNARSRLICVREDHRESGEPVNTLVAVDIDAGGAGTILFEGTDFVTNPALSPAGNEIAFITWSHPNMPWDDTQLHVLGLDRFGNVASSDEVPQEGNVSIKSPHFASDGTLYFVADFENWWNLYRRTAEGQAQAVFTRDIEMTSYALESAASAVIAYASEGLYYLARVDLMTGKLQDIGTALTSAGSISATDNGVFFAAATPSSQTAIYKLTGDRYDEVYRPNGPVIADDFRSVPEAISYPTGENGAERAFGFYYPPSNTNFRGPDDTLPPLIVKVHGGPVGATRASLSPAIQFWTSRGFAVFDVNHRGSTGYGRAFRKLLYPNWGIVDIEDAASGAKWLADEGFVDGEQLAIRGGSAGGYTVLASLAFLDVFKAGVSYFGISDLEAIARDTHKFESRFADQLIGPHPEARDIYIARSPIHSVDTINAPLLLLQGLEDEVVPPNQSEMIFDVLKKNCIPTAYLTFEGEGHGFRQPANNIFALNAELAFYGQIFGFTPAGDIEPVELITCKR